MIVLEEHSKITGKGQTTVPKRVRDTLGVRFGDEIVYRVTGDGAVTVENARRSTDESAVDAFLEFISSDIKRHPQNVTAIELEDARRLDSLLEGVDVDLDDDFRGATSI